VSAVKKRSVSIRGHQTSYSIEDAFNEVLLEMAHAKNLSLAGLIVSIDERRERDENLSSALRLAVLEWVKSRQI
jgi:predicted DNA-binding ribbon-helix-helix protein